MRRTDRLFEIIQILRSASGPISAENIAAQLEVSQRTVYRDIATLQGMRMPIDGEVGIGYVIRRGYDLPPLNFNEEELESIIVGISLLARTGDSKLQKAAERVLSKIEMASPASRSLRVSDWGIYGPDHTRLDVYRAAIRTEQKLLISYTNGDGIESIRTIMPVALTYYIEVAVVSAWCELREDFRNFRADRVADCTVLDEYFVGQGNRLREAFDTAENARNH